MSSAPTRLRCEHLENPVGILEATPRLSWVLSQHKDSRQTGYRIAVSSTEGGEADVWDSGKVDSDQSVLVPYGGPVVEERRRVYWRVKVWNEGGGEGDWSETAYWEVGIQASSWEAEWIGSSVHGGARTTAPVPYLRRSVSLGQKPVRARLYVTALGVYEFRINRAKVGDHELAPGWTDYRKRVRYQVFDVLEHLTEGQNQLGAMLGDGWYAGHIGWRHREFYGERPQLLAQLEVEYADGATARFVTDGDWRTSTGPILESDLLMGESYDARYELDGWDRLGYDDAGWEPVEVFPTPGIALVATMQAPIRVIELIHPVAEPVVTAGWEASEAIYDLGQNMVGRIRLKMRGKRGETVRIRYAEILDEKGKMYVENLRGARCTDYYTFRTDGAEEHYEPKFTFHGFRYVELRGFSVAPTSESVVGVVMHSDLERIGTFECSDPLVNQLQRNIDWGWRGNSLDVPTDCPQRDERLGWTGDAQAFVRTACFNRDVAAFFDKFSQDMEDGQGANGAIPMVLPTVHELGSDGGPAWADAVVICPWTIYLCYGDTAILERYYGSMQRFIEFLKVQSRDDIRSYRGMAGHVGFGDWLHIQAETPQELIGTAFFAYSAKLMSKIASVLGRAEDAAGYEALFEKEKAAFQRLFVTPGGRVCGETQTGYLLALQFDLLPSQLRGAATEALVWDIQRRGNKLSTGFVGSPYLNHVLSLQGKDDVAFKLLHQTAWPSWLYAVTKGATTIWERWDGWTDDKGFQDAGMNSFNHYAYGAIGAWLYQKVAGIDVSESGPGYKRIVLAPVVGDLSFASGSLMSPYGLIRSSWRIADGEFVWEFTVPANTKALVCPPGAEAFDAGPGEHRVVVSMG